MNWKVGAPSDTSCLHALAEAPLHSANIELRELLAVAAQSALRPSNLPSIQQHEQELANLEADQITKGKSKNEIEAKIGAKEMELAGLKDEMRNIEEWNVEQDVTGLKPESHGSA
jgi:hypothetical protein